MYYSSIVNLTMAKNALWELDILQSSTYVSAGGGSAKGTVGLKAVALTDVRVSVGGETEVHPAYVAESWVGGCGGAGGCGNRLSLHSRTPGVCL